MLRRQLSRKFECDNVDLPLDQETDLQPSARDISLDMDKAIIVTSKSNHTL